MFSRVTAVIQGLLVGQDELGTRQATKWAQLPGGWLQAVVLNWSSCVSSTSADPLMPCSAAALSKESIKCILRNERGSHPPNHLHPSASEGRALVPLAIALRHSEEAKIGSSRAERIGQYCSTLVIPDVQGSQLSPLLCHRGQSLHQHPPTASAILQLRPGSPVLWQGSFL